MSDKVIEPTPGKWRWYWRKSYLAGETDCGVVAEERPGLGVSVCRAPRYQTKEQWEVDGPVLAAAKDLLAACTAACDDVLGSNGLHGLDDGVLAQLLAAIAKAQGKE